MHEGIVLSLALGGGALHWWPGRWRRGHDRLPWHRGSRWWWSVVVWDAATAIRSTGCWQPGWTWSV